MLINNPRLRREGNLRVAQRSKKPGRERFIAKKSFDEGYRTIRWHVLICLAKNMSGADVDDTIQSFRVPENPVRFVVRWSTPSVSKITGVGKCLAGVFLGATRVVEKTKCDQLGGL